MADQDTLLSQFDELKVPFTNISPSSLNFPKLHSLQHISEATKRLGTPDNFDTEVTEHQHRTDVKIPYQRTNKRDPLPQIIKFIERRTALEDKLDYIRWNESSNLSILLETTNQRQLSGKIFDKPVSIKEISRMFGYPKLELAIQIFLHDVKFPGTGYRHRVNRRNLPKLSNPDVSMHKSALNVTT